MENQFQSLLSAIQAGFSFHDWDAENERYIVVGVLKNHLRLAFAAATDEEKEDARVRFPYHYKRLPYLVRS